VSVVYLATSISLFSGFFSLGAASFLYLRYRTVILRFLLLFLASLVLISLGAWLGDLEELIGPGAIRVWSSFFSLGGLALNVATVPFLVAALVSFPLEGPRKLLLVLWDGVLAATCVAFALVPDPDPVFTVMNTQLVLTIAGSLAVLALNLRNVGRLALRRALVAFLGISGVFLVFLVTDILVTRLGIRSLAFLDGLSLPAYLLALNVGSFLFAGRFLDSEPLVAEGRLTEACKAEFGLTAREAELIERLLDGSTNQDLADALYISRKTVENHLYNVFQKMQVRNRVQLIAALRVWNRETRE